MLTPHVADTRCEQIAARLPDASRNEEDPGAPLALVVLVPWSWKLGWRPLDQSLGAPGLDQKHWEN